MCELPCPCLESKSCSSKSGMVTKSCNPSVLLVGEEFEVKKGSPTTREARENLLPSTLLLVAMCELDMRVLKGDLVYR